MVEHPDPDEAPEDSEVRLMSLSCVEREHGDEVVERFALSVLE